MSAPLSLLGKATAKAAFLSFRAYFCVLLCCMVGANSLAVQANAAPATAMPSGRLEDYCGWKTWRTSNFVVTRSCFWGILLLSWSERGRQKQVGEIGFKVNLGCTEDKFLDACIVSDVFEVIRAHDLIVVREIYLDAVIFNIIDLRNGQQSYHNSRPYVSPAGDLVLELSPQSTPGVHTLVVRLRKPKGLGRVVTTEVRVGKHAVAKPLSWRGNDCVAIQVEERAGNPGRSVRYVRFWKDGHVWTSFVSTSEAICTKPLTPTKALRVQRPSDLK
jgi:hypothetical protein